MAEKGGTGYNSKVPAMNHPFRRLIPLCLAAAALSACGAAATLPPSIENSSLSARIGEGVWYAENGDHPGLAVPTDNGNSILVVPPGDGSSFVNGAFTIDVPDRESVQFRAQVGLPTGTMGEVRFRAFVQDNGSFPMLADVPAPTDGGLTDFTVDLSHFRGQALLLILAVSTPDLSPLSTSALWVEPAIITP
jgi:hypothetical protein